MSYLQYIESEVNDTLNRRSRLRQLIANDTILALNQLGQFSNDNEKHYTFPREIIYVIQSFLVYDTTSKEYKNKIFTEKMQRTMYHVTFEMTWRLTRGLEDNENMKKNWSVLDRDLIGCAMRATNCPICGNYIYASSQFYHLLHPNITCTCTNMYPLSAFFGQNDSDDSDSDND